MRGATKIKLFPGGRMPISIHAPHEGCDEAWMCEELEREKFQSTHPMRGATAIRSTISNGFSDFNPRTP